jgi:multiple sugar transport system permease protein
MGLWGAAGGMILWLAGLKGIPSQLYEAANIDGASPMKQFWNITVPQLSPLIFFQTVIGGIGVLQTFDSVYVAVRGENSGPNDSLLVPVYYLFQHAFYYFKLGYASAIAWLIFLIALAITAVQFIVAKKWVHYEVDN